MYFINKLIVLAFLKSNQRLETEEETRGGKGTFSSVIRAVEVQVEELMYHQQSTDLVHAEKCMTYAFQLKDDL